MSTFLDNWLLRRAMSAPRGGGIECPYITDGLVFWLDGINKGGHSGAWTDLIGGIVLTNNGCIFGADGVEFDGTSFLNNESCGRIGAKSEGATIEVCIEIGTVSSAIILTQKFEDSISIMLLGDLTLIGVGPLYQGTRYASNSVYTISGNSERVLRNGILQTKLSATGSVDTSVENLRIGSKNASQYWFNGIIHSIRIYNRQLTEAEMLSNQQTDNARFNLGLSI